MRNRMEDMVESPKESLMHYGVKGMHWGVWNDETRARYTGRGLRGESAKKLKKAISNRVDKARTFKKSVSDKHQQKKEERAEAKAFDKKTRKQYNLTKKQYDRLRNTTLKSNDPTIVARGMHLLNDQELDSKINRLEREAKIRNLSTIKRSTEAKARKEAAEARSKTLPYQLGKAAGNMAIKTVNDTLLKPFTNDVYKKYSKTIQDNVRQERTDRNNSERSAETSRSNSSVQNPVYEAVVESVSDIGSNSSAASQYNRRGHLLLEEARKR